MRNPIFFLPFFLFILACTSPPPMEPFDSFHSHLFRDSTFQFGRVTFPLPGFFMNNELLNKKHLENAEIKGDTVWTQANWTMLHHDFDTSEYNVSYEKTDSVVIETIEGKRRIGEGKCGSR
jgi:hypothetical protein